MELLHQSNGNEDHAGSCGPGFACQARAGLPGVCLDSFPGVLPPCSPAYGADCDAWSSDLASLDFAVDHVANVDRGKGVLASLPAVSDPKVSTGTGPRWVLPHLGVADHTTNICW